MHVLYQKLLQTRVNGEVYEMISVTLFLENKALSHNKETISLYIIHHTGETISMLISLY